LFREKKIDIPLPLSSTKRIFGNKFYSIIVLNVREMNKDDQDIWPKGGDSFPEKTESQADPE
jgi:hypothetical protein